MEFTRKNGKICSEKREKYMTGIVDVYNKMDKLRGWDVNISNKYLIFISFSSHMLKYIPGTKATGDLSFYYFSNF